MLRGIYSTSEDYQVLSQIFPEEVLDCRTFELRDGFSRIECVLHLDRDEWDDSIVFTDFPNGYRIHMAINLQEGQTPLRNSLVRQAIHHYGANKEYVSRAMNIRVKTFASDLYENRVLKSVSIDFNQGSIWREFR